MNRLNCIDRVYVRIHASVYDDITAYGFENLIDLVAIAKGFDENGEALFSHGNVCRGKTQAYIVRETNRFISNFAQTQHDENMKLAVSRRQIRKMVHTFRKKETCISGYALVILHVILLMISDIDKNSDLWLEAIRLLRFFHKEIIAAISVYHNQFKDDFVAHFIMECCPPLDTELANPQNLQSHGRFPPIPRIRPYEL